DGPSAEAARAMVNAIANPQMPEIGERFLGTVVKTTTFGAFVSLLPGKDGLLHISEIRKMVGGKRIDAVEDVLSVGQKVQVELKEIDPRGKLSLAAVTAEGADSGEGGESHSEAGSDEHGSDDHGSDGQGHGDDNGGERREGGERRQRNRRRGGGRGRGDRGDNGGHGGGDHSES
ncbi:MAG TPA: S1 RNA-binding domain-containing protein, partial [Phycicoccus sp.]|nr:S1 RNA-binding domain-containing protein [Phycicoccus sp.]